LDPVLSKPDTDLGHHPGEPLPIRRDVIARRKSVRTIRGEVVIGEERDRVTRLDIVHGLSIPFSCLTLHLAAKDCDNESDHRCAQGTDVKGLDEHLAGFAVHLELNHDTTIPGSTTTLH